MNAHNNSRPPIPATQKVPLATLEISTNTGPGRYICELNKPVMNVGRLPGANEIVIDDPIVSAYHFQIIQQGDQYILLHPPQGRTSTANGLIYHEQYIDGNQSFQTELVNGDIFRIGDENGRHVTLEFNDGTGSAQGTAPITGSTPLSQRITTLGRATNNTLVLDHPQISAHHARIEQIQRAHRLTDLSSTNHTYINGQRVYHQILQPGDDIRIGPFKFVYTGTHLVPDREGSESIRIDAFNLQKPGRIHDLSLAIPAKKFVALVGGSGAGKSTLLDALNGLRPASTGTVLYNGQDYYRNFAAFSTQLGYVPQDDIVHRDLTVERALYYAARLRLPADFTEQQLQQRIDEVLTEVEMTHRRAHLVSKLSGGQRKRVSIALELLSRPSIFFLDEPTSGLDPGLDRKMMKLLYKLADRGHTIVLVTHATNNINFCDFVCILAEGGRLAYFGPPLAAKTYFGKKDFAEIYEELDATRDTTIPAMAEARFRASPEYQHYVSHMLKGSAMPAQQSNRKLKAPARGNMWRQFVILCLRYLELLKNDTGTLLILLLQSPIIAVILLGFIQPGGFDPGNMVQCPTTAQVLTTTGFPDQPTSVNPIVSKSCSTLKHFLQTNSRGKAYASLHGGVQKALQGFILPGSADAPKILFIMAFACIMFGCINAAREIVKESAIYRRERAVNLGIFPYILSKVVVLGTLCLLQSLLLVFVVNLRDPFPGGILLPGFIEIYITLALTSLAGLMLGLLISALVPNTDRAMSFVPIVLIPQVVFAGTLFALKGGWLQILGAVFAVRWAMAALGSSIGLHSDKLEGDTLFGNDYTFHGTLFSTYSQTDAVHHLLMIWGVLLLMICLFGCATMAALWLREQRR